MSQAERALQFSSGAAIGLVVGLIAGLSISPVTQTLLGALSAGLLVLLGFKAPDTGSSGNPHALRTLGFGTFCSLALIIGIGLRTHSVLSPSLSLQKQNLVNANVFTPNEIDQILLSTNFGLTSSAPSTQDGSKIPPNNKTNSSNAPGEKESPSQAGTGEQAKPGTMGAAGLLRSESGTTFCRVARRGQFKDLSAYLAEIHRVNPRLYHLLQSAPEQYRDQLSKSLSDYLCP